MNKKYLFLLFSILFFSSCYNFLLDSKVKQNYICAPEENWIYYTDVPIIFSCNVDSNSISWYSSLDGKLGEGSGLVKFLSKGNHRIICKIENFEEVIQINVVEKELNSSDTKRDIIFANKQQIFFQKGISLPIFYSFAGSCSNFKFNNISIAEETCHEKTIKVFRDIKIASTITTKKIYKQNIKRSIAQSNSYAVGTEKDFYLIKTDNQLTEPHIISATMIKSTDNCTIWLANNSECDKKLIEQCVKNFEELIFPRLQIIWEKWSDIDNDNKIALLFSPTINKEGTAIGFFNPSDLFAKVSDINSDAYNPYSNQMDIFYLALPVEDKTSSYTINSISATMAHEMTHIFTFYNKTFKQVELGNKNFPQEELFLDEGLSHLCENLCGFGVSGGNIDFIKLFFEDTSKYSFCKENRFGQLDSAGMRGAITLFLSWLFWKKGGYLYKENTIIDNGGITFLKNIVKSSVCGWESLGLAYGKPTDTLFMEFVEEINKQRYLQSEYDYKIDPVTREPIDFFCNMKEYFFNGQNICLSFPNVKSVSDDISLLPYSFLLLEEISFASNEILEINVDKIQSNCIFSCIKK